MEQQSMKHTQLLFVLSSLVQPHQRSRRLRFVGKIGRELMSGLPLLESLPECDIRGLLGSFQIKNFQNNSNFLNVKCFFCLKFDIFGSFVWSVVGLVSRPPLPVPRRTHQTGSVRYWISPLISNFN